MCLTGVRFVICYMLEVPNANQPLGSLPTAVKCYSVFINHQTYSIKQLSMWVVFDSPSDSQMTIACIVSLGFSQYILNLNYFRVPLKTKVHNVEAYNT